MMTTHRHHRLAPAVALTFALGATIAVSVSGVSGVSGAQTPPAPLTNLAHIDWLGDSVSPPAQAGHTTYRLAEEPEVGVLWTYADRQSDGTYRRIGGGQYDPVTDTYGQGAFNADDISRAAVVYLRHWMQTGAETSRDTAYQLLRGLTFMQTVDGPNTGNVVLWMQPDGTLHPSAIPVELPDPSDSGPSYWLARTIWALGEGVRAFMATGDPADADFAAFLSDRMTLAVDAVQRQVLVRYGQWLDIDGVPVPAWLIVDGADATGEALLGLSAFVEATGDANTAARIALQQLGEGVAAMRSGDPRDWPFGAVLPWALSQADWHAWGGLPPAGLARAAAVTGDGDMLGASLSDVASFTPHLLISAGPENGWLPSPSDRVQIAYGAESRVESIVAAADASGRAALRLLAGVAASWFFGNNPAGQQMYDPATGRTYDGVSGDGVVNFNSGAESTIHGLLAMLALDADPEIAAVAQVADVAERHTWSLVEAESGALAQGAAVVDPDDWTGESLWSGGRYVEVQPGGSFTIAISAGGANLLLPVVRLDPPAGTTTWTVPHRTVGTIDHSAVGPQGDSPAPGLLAMVTLPRTVRDVSSVEVRGRGAVTQVDAVMVQPEVEHVVLSDGTSSTALVRNFANRRRTVSLSMPAGATATITVFDATGQTVGELHAPAATVDFEVPPGGFAIVRS
jgi:hypothetical protein